MVTAEDKVELNENEKKILGQIEYYFSDINLLKDRFMKYQLYKNEGWVPLDVLMTFNKLKQMTTNKDDVIDVIKKSDSDQLEISECQTKIRRIKPFPKHNEEFFKQLNQRTLHLKGFVPDSTFEELKEFCSQFGEVESLEMRKRRDSIFKGCIFVVFKNLSDAEKVLAKEKVYYKELELLKENKERYFQRKKAYLQSKPKRENKQKSSVAIPGAILKIMNLLPETDRFEIKNALMKPITDKGVTPNIAFITKIDESGQCFVRFSVKDGAKKVVEILQKYSNEPLQAAATGDDNGETKVIEKSDEKSAATADDDNGKTKTLEKSDDKPESAPSDNEGETKATEESDEKSAAADDEAIKVIDFEIGEQKVKISLATSEEESKFWNEYQAILNNRPHHKKRKWQRGTKRPFPVASGGDDDGKGEGEEADGEGEDDGEKANKIAKTES